MVFRGSGFSSPNYREYKCKQQKNICQQPQSLPDLRIMRQMVHTNIISSPISYDSGIDYRPSHRCQRPLSAVTHVCKIAFHLYILFNTADYILEHIKYIARASCHLKHSMTSGDNLLSAIV